MEENENQSQPKKNIFKIIKGKILERHKLILRKIEYERLKRVRKHISPKYSYCKNCGTQLMGMYCHRCGQYALDIEQPFWKYIKQYFENVYQFDSKIWQTLYQLFGHPGLLTNEFNAGKINSYVHPFRLYMFISVIFFTVFFWIASDAAYSKINEKEPKNLPESVLTQLKAGNMVADTSVYVYNASDFVALLKERGLESADRLLKITPSVGGLSLVEMPSLVLDSCFYTTEIGSGGKEKLNDLYTSDFDDNLLNTTDTLEMKQIMNDAKKLSEGIMPAYDWTSDIINRESRFQMKSFIDTVLTETSKYTPIFMMFLLPVFALITQFVFRKAGKPYMSHFVGALHINSVFLTLLPVPIAAALLSDINWDICLPFLYAFYAYILFYMVVAFRNIFGYGWWKTIKKTLYIYISFSLIALGIGLALLILLIIHEADKWE